MASEEDKQGVNLPAVEGSPSSGSEQTNGGTANPFPEADSRVDDTYDQYGDVQPSPTATMTGEGGGTTPSTTQSSGGPPKPPAPPHGGGDSGGDDGNGDEEHMLRMSFLEHLEELRSRILKALAGVGVAFVLCLVFANDLWMIVSEPAFIALQNIGIKDGKLAQLTPMETFSTVWVKLPLLASVFLASPWLVFQVWGFIAPGLYKRERRWAAPFVLCSAGLFITGGLFAYFVAFRYGLTFLLGIGRDIRIQPMVSVTEYFDLFVNVTMGVGLVFEMPVLIFFLTLLRIVTPGFLIRHSRYAILIIVIIAAVVTPTPDVFNLMLFAVPMIILFFVGIFASYLLVLNRENRRFPWKLVLKIGGIILLILAAVLYFATIRHGFHWAPHWPFLIR
jgi:sec-independent protein translocase protein TatC